MAISGIPWRGPGDDRPDLPLPPGPMPLRSDGGMRKRWRYVGFYGESVMLCAARAEVGLLGQAFWVLWDRQQRRDLGRTVFRPGSREVVLDGPRLLIDAPDLHVELTLGEAAPIESICPSGEAGWGWTRKRAGVPMRGYVEMPGRRIELDGLGVDDESAGYQARHTSWHWSAGVGTATDGRAVAWNLVAGINDPPACSERAVWIDGVPHEPAPVTFDGLDAIRFAGGSDLDFVPGVERARDDNFLLVRSTYRHRFGTFSGALDGTPLAEGRGVMESHDALW
jgi:Protein of unknown function (DUF2804)